MGLKDEAESVRLVVGFLRLLRRWTQSDLAQACELDRKTIGRYESGESVPPREVVDRLAGAAGISRARLDQLFDLFGRIAEESRRDGAREPDSMLERLTAGLAAELAAEIESEIFAALSQDPLKPRPLADPTT